MKGFKWMFLAALALTWCQAQASELWKEGDAGIYFDLGSVGIGTEQMLAPLHVVMHEDGALDENAAVFVRNQSHLEKSTGLLSEAVGGRETFAIYGRAQGDITSAAGRFVNLSAQGGYGLHADAQAQSGPAVGLFATSRSPDGYGIRVSSDESAWSGYFTGGRSYFGNRVGIGTESISDSLHVRAPSGQNALRVQTGGRTAFRVYGNSGVGVGANYNSSGVPERGLRVHGDGDFGGGLSATSLTVTTDPELDGYYWFPDWFDDEVVAPHFIAWNNPAEGVYARSTLLLFHPDRQAPMATFRSFGDEDDRVDQVALGGWLDPLILQGMPWTYPREIELHVHGRARKPGGGLWSTFSDERLKDEVELLETGMLDRLTSLNSYRYTYLRDAIEQGLGHPGEYIGFMAQEVEMLFSQWVYENNQGYLEISEQGFTAIVAQALRELREEQRLAVRQAEEGFRAEVAARDERVHELSERLAAAESTQQQIFALQAERDAMSERLAVLEALLLGGEIASVQSP
ncbi:tail fiber domain-containing protein [Wenzhouxiangella sp. AB-CW3]|uniref:tail fiber domain-containing protein n=1 Tax=Wenzhouxiangella sp. AB-CW3 TaxID=2771012 RepID=UPI00168AA4E3|nr:tail fiber domain-containing protein [Wenzhouxiangella sp. AB-CW3]QOC23664.1 tail fiber domain-containing protein [Wenzhouxiangella sp. AB-CW3]